MDEVRTKKIKIVVNQEKEKKIHNLCLQWRDKILEKSSLREGINQEWRKRIGGFSTFKNFFNSWK